MIAPANSHQHHEGFSLVELMVAMTIGLIILAAVGTLFVNSGKTYNNQDRLARVQENGRFAMYYLLRDLRMTSYYGCQKDFANHLSNDLNTNTGFFFSSTSLTTPLEGIDNVASNPKWSPSGDTTSLPTKLWKDATASIAQPDILAIRMIDSASTANVTDNPIASLPANPTIDKAANNFQKGDIVLIADCARADLFQISDAPISVTTTSSKLPHSNACAAGVTPCNWTPEFSKAYDTAARVFKFSTRRYFIGINPNGTPSLYRDDNGLNAIELVEGIESLQILYGIANPPNKAPSIYRKANALSLGAADPTADWANVVSVKIGILARTTNTKDTDIDNNTYDVNGTILGPFNDRNSRRVFSATVSLKNMTLP
jgi:type IV pilus assembly protein PilW